MRRAALITGWHGAAFAVAVAVLAGKAPAVAGMLAGTPPGLLPIVSVASPYEGRPDLKVLRAKLVAKKAMSTHELQLLADAGDGLAAFRLAERLAVSDDPAVRSDAAFYFAVAVYRGRDYAMPPLQRLLADPAATIAPERLARIEKALVNRANAGDAVVAGALAELYREGRPFGRKPAEARAMLALAARDTSDGALALQMATTLASQGPLEPEDIREIRRYLQIALASSDFRVRTAAENLLRSYPEPGEGG